MARVYKAPGVYRQEIDLSEILVATGISNGGIVVKAKKGPVNRPVLITNDKEYTETFGRPIFTSGSSSASEVGKLIPEYGYGAYAALEFLKESSTLYVVRSFDEDNDAYSNVEVEVSSLTALDFDVASTGIVGNAYKKGDRLDQADYISILDEYAQTSGGTNFIIGALGPGLDGNDVAVTITPFSLSADWRFAYDEYPTSAEAASAVSGLSTTELQTWYPIASKVSKINVYTKASGQTWDSLYRNNDDRNDGKLFISPVETFYGSLSQNLKDGNGNNLFIESVVNGNSGYIYVKKGASLTSEWAIAGSDDSDLLPTDFTSAGEEYVKFVSTATSGDANNRLMVLSGGDSQQSTGLNDITGWNIFEDRENVSVGILIGTSYNTTYKQEIARIASVRQDCIAVGQTGQLSDDTVTQLLTAEQYGYRTPSYMALYAGYSKVFDNYNDKFVYLPNACLGAALFARVDNIANPWDAPAGINRAVLSVLDQRKIFSDTEIGNLYDRNINCAKFIRGTGHTMWGQKTAQMKASALDRINVRRNLLFIENNIEIALLPFVFENNTAKTRLRVWSLVDEFLAGVQAGGGLTAYQVVVDETNNTPAVIDSNRLNVDIYVQPSRAIEFIQLTTVITRTGVSLEEVRIATA